MNAGLGRLLCRVVTIQLLVLEKLDLDYGWSESSRQLRMASIKIPISGFLLDDGSSLCCCWADAESAKMLLRLEEVFCQLFFLHGADSVGRTDAYHDTIGYRLEMMLKKHVKIIVRNNRNVPDDSLMDFTFSADSDEVLSNAEECLLRYIIINACQGSTFNVIGCKMDSTSLDLFDRDGEKWENTMGPLTNIWATDVLHINPLKKARNLLEDLSR
ncbi:hypothetical protein HPP92_010556 [Vanilla planifolia]|nr:hypothetical protein HPP92_010556 [Vanilla planifolia]